jgi:hypothetical protein
VLVSVELGDVNVAAVTVPENVPLLAEMFSTLMMSLPATLTFCIAGYRAHRATSAWTAASVRKYGSPMDLNVSMLGLNPVVNPIGCGSGTARVAAATAGVTEAVTGVHFRSAGRLATDFGGAGAGAFGSGTNVAGGFAVPRDEKSGVGAWSHENIS